MKLRIKGDTIRLRLSRPEVDQFAATGRVADTVHFPDGALLEYGLKASADAVEIDARFIETYIGITVPTAVAEKWTASETETGFATSLHTRHGKTLHILVEKDFQCLHKRAGEDEADMYPNPAAPT